MVSESFPAAMLGLLDLLPSFLIIVSTGAAIPPSGNVPKHRVHFGEGRRMPARLTWFLPLALLLPGAAWADDTPDALTISGSFRVRYEAIDGQARTGFNSSDQFTNLRTQFLAQYEADPLRLGLEIYDSRVFGAMPGSALTTSEVNTLEPVQAFVAVDLPGLLGKGSAVTLKAGRMTLDLGSRRLVALDDYRNTVNSYTGLRGDLSMPHGIKATLVYVLPQQRLPGDYASMDRGKIELDKESFDAVLWGGLASKAKALGRATAELSFYHFGERDAPALPTRDRSLNSLGVRLFADPMPGRLDYELEAIWQSGEISASLAPGAATQQVSASYVRGRIGYSFAGALKPRVAFEVDRASGDGPGGRYGRFDPLFGARRSDLGPAGLYNAIGRSNIFSPGVRLEISPGQRLDAFVGYRAMWLAADTDSFSTTGVRDASGRSGDFAGHQIDTRLRYWLLPKRLRFEADAVLLAKGRFLRQAPNATPGDATRYVSFNLTGYL